MTVTSIEPETRAAQVLKGLSDAFAFIAANPGLPLGSEYAALHVDIATGSPEQDAAEVQRIAGILGVAPHQGGGQYIADRDFGGGVWYTAAAKLGTIPAPRDSAGQVRSLAAWVERDGIASGPLAARVADSLTECTSPGMRAAVNAVTAGEPASQALRNAAVAVAEIAAVEPLDWAAEAFAHGHGSDDLAASVPTQRRAAA